MAFTAYIGQRESKDFPNICSSNDQRVTQHRNLEAELCPLLSKAYRV